MKIGIDIGGTFTDVVALSGDRSVSLKVSSTPSAPEEAVITGIGEAIRELGARPEDVTSISHGTTVGSNTLLQRVGSRTGLLTTRGFRDVLEIGRLRTPDMFNLTWEKPRPLVRRRHRMEIGERVDAEGRIVRALPEDEVRRAAEFLISEGVEAVAVCYLNAHRNSETEARTAQILRAEYGALDVSVSSEILPVAGEYERSSTVCVNAYVKRALGGYLRRLEEGVRGLGIRAPIYVSNSNGGVTTIRSACEQPVFFISSGRSAGAVGAQRLGRNLGRANLIAFDMGGTTASASLVLEGELIRTDEYEFRAGISTTSRFIKAGGYLMRVPAIDVAEVGSGAGSIARVDEGGLLEVGPRSAGAVPGPACYGKGGTEPTVTDANLVLGYLGTELASDALSLDAGLAAAAIEAHICGPLGVDLAEAAHGIREIVTVNMARAIRAVTVERGEDPRDFDLLAFGGSGPAHACDLARLMGIEKVIFPATPGVFTAAGLLGSRQEIYEIATLPALSAQAVAGLQEKLETAAVARMEKEGVPASALGFEYEIDMRFVEQDATIPVPVPGRGDRIEIAELREAFLSAYRGIYGFASSDEIEAVNLRLTAFRGGRAEVQGRSLPASRHHARAGAPPEVRRVYFGPEFGWCETPVYAQGAQPATLTGPAVVVLRDTTIVIAPDFRLDTDADGSLRATCTPLEAARNRRIAS
ncbi:MAG: hydantoinase/oxoprolinase family protein [Roseovarius sp.]